MVIAAAWCAAATVPALGQAFRPSRFVSSLPFPGRGTDIAARNRGAEPDRALDKQAVVVENRAGRAV